MATIKQAIQSVAQAAKNYTDTVAATKVNVVSGKGLSTNDLTATLKSNYDKAYTHSQAAHAPSDAQKNSDITKTEIENKLTGNITTHTHDTYAPKDSPSFTSSISMGRKEGTTIGVGSVAVGYNVTASGDYSHAEGSNTNASGYCSHAEGSNTNASGDYSHAEGATTASGDCSHAEGLHSEASADYSHAEGFATKASGPRSHAEGYYTIAAGNSQHVQGKHNIEDTTNTYAHIVGNGTSGSARSNAHTLDWDGNAWFAGNVKVGAGNKELATTDHTHTPSQVGIAEATDSEINTILTNVFG